MGFFKNLSIEAEEEGRKPINHYYSQLAKTKIKAPELAEFIETVLPDVKHEKYILQVGQCNLAYDTREEYICALSALIDVKENLYYIPCTFAAWRLDKDALHKQCLFVDIDDIDDIDLSLPGPQIVQILCAKFPQIKQIMPTYIIKSGHGLHLYWKTSTYSAQRTDWKDITRRLIAYLRGDVSCQNASRIMRCPCSWNTKKSAIKVEFIYKSSADYSFSDFDCITADYFAYHEKMKAQSTEKRRKTMEINGTKAGRKKIIKKNTKEEKTPEILEVFQPKTEELNDSQEDLEAAEKFFYENYEEFLPKPKKTIKPMDHSRYKTILQDMDTYWNKHNGKIDGHREMFVFLSCVVFKKMGKDTTNAKEFVLSYFGGTDFEAEAIQQIENIYKNPTEYRYTNQKIAEILGYTADDLRQMNGCYSDDEVKERRKEKNKRNALRQKEKRNFRAKHDEIAELVEEELPNWRGKESIKDIQEKYKKPVSQATIYRVYSERKMTK